MAWIKNTEGSAPPVGKGVQVVVEHLNLRYVTVGKRMDRDRWFVIGALMFPDDYSYVGSGCITHWCPLNGLPDTKNSQSNQPR